MSGSRQTPTVRRHGRQRPRPADFPDRRGELIVDGPNQLWVADLTYVAIVAGFVYVALIMDAWSRRIVGYTMGRGIDARLTLAAFDAAIAHRQPPEGCLHQVLKPRLI